MTYQEEIDLQKRNFFALAKRLDSFWNGFSGPDPEWDIPYPLRSAKGKWGRCYACRYKKTTGFGFSNRLRATVDAGENRFDFDMSHIWFNRRAALESADDVLAWLDGKVPCDKHGGDHPWEIKRGGNTTHIDLYVHRPSHYDWCPDGEKKEKMSRTVKVGLCGHHIGRIVETVKMFLAIRKAGLPIWMSDAQSVRNRILGCDWIGIIPESNTLHRGWQDFPGDFHIADVMHFSDSGRHRRHALPFVSWKPLPVILPRTFARGV